MSHTHIWLPPSFPGILVNLWLVPSDPDYVVLSTKANSHFYSFFFPLNNIWVNSDISSSFLGLQIKNGRLFFLPCWVLLLCFLFVAQRTFRLCLWSGLSWDSHWFLGSLLPASLCALSQAAAWCLARGWSWNKGRNAWCISLFSQTRKLVLSFVLFWDLVVRGWLSPCHCQGVASDSRFSSLLRFSYLSGWTWWALSTFHSHAAGGRKRWRALERSIAGTVRGSPYS